MIEEIKHLIKSLEEGIAFDVKRLNQEKILKVIRRYKAQFMVYMKNHNPDEDDQYFSLFKEERIIDFGMEIYTMGIIQGEIENKRAILNKLKYILNLEETKSENSVS